MGEQSFFDGLVIVWLGLAGVTAISLIFLPAPYGRHLRSGWGPTIPAWVGWIVMELPAPVGLAVWWALGRDPFSLFALIFLAMWQIHYVQRTFIYPVVRRGRGRPIPVSVVAMAIVFNLGNAYLNGRAVFTFASYDSSWLTDPRFLLGAGLFFAGWAINIHADTVLLRLRRPGETGYRIPRGGLYRWITCPNYLGEILEWFGWALATWTLGGLTFALWTAANLAPRAWTHHRWYRENFSDYPPKRRALVPFVW